MTDWDDKQTIFYYTLIQTALGWMGVCGNRQGLKRVVLPEKTREGVFCQAAKSFVQEGEMIENALFFSSLVEKIKNYFEGKPVLFDDQRVNLSGYTSFQKNVLSKAREIPYGSIRTYRWLAEESGHPKAYRAAGGVMRINPLPLVIPCHRVLGSDGKLVGFSSTLGVSLKRRMLEIEGALPISKKTVKQAQENIIEK